MKKKRNGKSIFNISVIVISLGIMVYFCVSENGVIDLIRTAGNFDYGWLIMAIVCNAVNILIDAYLIYRFTRNSCPTFNFRTAFKTSMVGQFFSAVTPFSTGGQPMQIYVMSKRGVKPGIGTSALVQRFVVYQSTLVAYSILAIAILANSPNSNFSPLMWSFAVFGFASQAFVILMLLLFSFSRKLTHSLLNLAGKLLSKMHMKNLENKLHGFEEQLTMFHESNRELYKNRKLVVETYVLTVVQLTAMFIIPYCIYRTFNLSGGRILDMISSQAFVTMATCFIPLPGAAGASEVSFMGFFASLFPPETMKSAVLLWRVITYYGVILFCAPFSRLAKHRKEEAAGGTEEQAAPQDGKE